MKKLLLLFMLSFVIATQAMYGQFCENESIDLRNLQPDWMNDKDPTEGSPAPGQTVWIQNTENYQAIYNGNTVSFHGSLTPQTDLPNLSFNSSGEASVSITCVNMIYWELQPSGYWISGNTNISEGPVTIIVKQGPSILDVTNTGSCSNVSAIGLSSSESGVNYQLNVEYSATGSAIGGTGSAISFGIQATVGRYTVEATRISNSCYATMNGSSVIYASPIINSITATGSSPYGTNSGTTIGVNTTQTGVNYQLFNGPTATGSTVAGTGTAINFGLQTGAGTYSVQGTNANCTSTMSGSITINTSPAAYTITGTGSAPYCTSTGTTIGLSGSQTTVSYQLYNGAAAVGPALAGTGSALSFGAQAAQGTYTVIATNSNNLCTSNMAGSITINTTPTVTLADFTSVCLNTPTFALTGGSPASGTYTSSGAGVSSNNFNPSLAGVGTPTITYTYTLNGCSSSAAKTLTVKSLPSIITTPIPAVCVNTPAVSLTPYFSATPAGVVPLMHGPMAQVAI